MVYINDGKGGSYFITDPSALSEEAKSKIREEAIVAALHQNSEGEIRITQKTSQPEHGGSYSTYRIKEIYIVCPRCKIGRWIVAASVYKSGFSGLCTKCVTELMDMAFAPYSRTARIIALRNKVDASRKRLSR
ncbi:MAG: hypothetical protein PHU23_08700 [Dehalococcoidales bacterium]|nr:hypothetical protein [Dehalococcoidales bacterium]